MKERIWVNSMIRILQIVTTMNRGGLETMLMNYYRNIDRNQIQFDFLVHRDCESDYDQEIKNLGGKIYHMPKLVPWSKNYRKKLKEFFREHPEYKIVHVHQDCLSSVALQCAKECGIPVRIAHSHSSSQDKNLKYLIKRYYMKKIPKYATYLFACSKTAGDWMFDGHRYHIIHNAIDVKKYDYNKETALEVRRQYHLKDSNIVVGHVGRFNIVKNHDFLIDIFTECLKINDKCRLLLVGDGEERKKIEQKVKELGIQDKVIFTGVRSDVEKLMQAMDIFVFPSVYEGLPVTMVEAQEAGLPCVISDQVSEECMITKNLVTRISLRVSPQKWARVILKNSQMGREDHSEEVRQAGYDINSEARKLQRFYLRCAEKER